MNIENFEQELNELILKRGEKYYREGRVRSLMEKGPGYYTANVAGTNSYRVHIHMKNSTDIESMECDCPYTYRPYCKHMAAVLYALRGRLQAIPDVVADNTVPSVKKAPEKDSLSELLNKQPKAALVEVLLAAARENDMLKAHMKAIFSNPADEKNSWLKLMRSCINSFKGRDNFIRWNECDKALQGTYKVLEHIQIAIDCKEFLMATELILAVMREMLKMTQFADDSDGGISYVLDSVKSLLASEVIAITDKEQREILFTKILTESKNKIYGGWLEERVSLITACISLADSLKQKRRLDSYFEKYMVDNDASYAFNNYTQEKITILKYQLLKKFDKEKVDAFLSENRAFAEIREILLKKAITGQKYLEAEKLSLEGEKNDAELPGLVKKWKQIRFQIYELENKTTEMRSLACELLIKYTCFDYYTKLKKLYDEKEWQKIYIQILDRLEKQKYVSRIYCQIVIAEKDWHNLLKYTKYFPEEILRYYKYLWEIYPQEVFAVFKEFIMQFAETCTERRHYKTLCSYLRILCKIGGKETTSDIKEKLSAKYPRRRSLLEELAKVD